MIVLLPSTGQSTVVHTHLLADMKYSGAHSNNKRMNIYIYTIDNLFEVNSITKLKVFLEY